MTFSTSQLISDLVGIYEPIHEKWKHHALTDTHLWKLSEHKSAVELLAEDIKHVGLYFAAADLIGINSELNLIAECLAYLKPALSHQQMEQRIQSYIYELRHTPIVNEHMELKEMEIHAPISWRIAQYLCANGHISETPLEALHTKWAQLADHILLRDGNITKEEDIRLQQFYAALN